MKHLKYHNLLLKDNSLWFPDRLWPITQPTHLHRHDLVAGLVHHLVDGAVGPAADLAQVLEVLGREVPVLLRRDLQLSRRLDAVRPQPLSAKIKATPCCRVLGDKQGSVRTPERRLWRLNSHVGVLEGRPGRVECEPRRGLDGGVGKVQLQGFTFT